MNNQFNQDPNQPAGGMPSQSWPPPGNSQINQGGMVPPDNQVPTVQPLVTEQQIAQPVAMETPGGGKRTLILVIVLIILVIMGGLILASFQGWISLGGIEKLWGGGTSDTSTSVTPTTTPTPTPMVNQNDLKRKNDLANLKTALKKYYQAKQSYPEAATVQKTSDTDNALKVLVPDYIAQIPVDPLSPVNYYGYKSDGKTFELTSVLEDKADPAGIQTGNIFLYKVTDSSVETPTASTETPASSSSATTNTDMGTSDTNSAIK